MDKYSKYVENNLKQSSMLSHMIPPLGKLGKRKAQNRKNHFAKSKEEKKDDKDGTIKEEPNEDEEEKKD